MTESHFSFCCTATVAGHLDESVAGGTVRVLVCVGVFAQQLCVDL